MSRALKGLALFFAFVVIYTISRHAIGSSSSSTTTTSSPSTTTSVPAVTTTTAGPAACAAGDFSGRFNQGQGAGGDVYASVTVTKNTPGSCTLRGWPRLTLLDGQGGLIATTATDAPNATTSGAFLSPPQANQPPRTLTLGNNQSATFDLIYSDVSVVPRCPSAVTLSAQLPAGASETLVTASPPVQARRLPVPCRRCR
ncbi:MAG TPA: DUF4232 domain-containing protein, partial [Acidimicrobiales bacterium]|nr:DUF4232 domain-containing protein [Acidimicrobiales bacterium]